MKQIVLVVSCLLAMSCNSKKQEDPKLIGKWNGAVKDSETGGSIEKISLEFTKDGKLIQQSGEGEMQLITTSTYETQQDKLITVETATKEKTEGNYSIKNDTLSIIYEGVQNKYVKLK
ncbi:MAG: hypothetical protein K0R59_309 [Sphingobacterium sp.]|jgi:uncharacterized protein (TIGR03066 family)|uniref:hypothetical protein n=1 Tax=unclassified Sphingobacterium TaxID=2609468 RepID=UPI002A68DCE0|nr:hypothetical protein [Sphingobacterium sp.]